MSHITMGVLEFLSTKTTTGIFFSSLAFLIVSLNSLRKGIFFLCFTSTKRFLWSVSLLVCLEEIPLRGVLYVPNNFAILNSKTFQAFCVILSYNQFIFFNICFEFLSCFPTKIFKNFSWDNYPKFFIKLTLIFSAYL